MHRTVAAVLVGALSLALASCGGSEVTTVSGAELVQRLNAVCVAGEGVLHEHMHGRTASAYLSAIIENQKYVLKRIGNLETTGSAKAPFDGFKDTVRKRLAALERVAAASRADYQSVLARERPVISVAGSKTHEALVALGAKHVCI